VGYGEMEEDTIAMLAASLNLARLTRLLMNQNDLGNSAVIALANSPHLTRLEVLELGGNNLDAEGVEALAESPTLARLRALELRGNWRAGRAARAIAASSTLAGLERLGWTLGLDAGRDAAELLGPSSGLTRLRVLYLAGVNPDVCRVVAAAPQLSTLEELTVSARPCADAGAGGLSACPRPTRR